MESYLDALARGPLHRFDQWPNRAVPRVCAGLYSIWLGDRFIYVGMSGRGMQVGSVGSAPEGKAKGLFTRLASHASGRRSGDQFCVYVADRLVLPALTADQIRQIGNGILSMDGLVREFIHRELSYRFVDVADGRTAFQVENHLLRNGLQGQLPLLNAVLPVRTEGRRV